MAAREAAFSLAPEQGPFIPEKELAETISYDAVDEFIAEGLISDVISIIKSGKEATAFLCRADASLETDYVVAKVYHERDRRNFANANVYEVGDRILKGRVARAVANKSSVGREIQSSVWVDHEFEVMSALNYAGVDIPAPIASTERAILMEFVGEGMEAAPQLQDVRLDRYEAETLLGRMLWNIETMLRENCIHADLSAYNVLYDEGRLAIIDMPQCADPRFNKKARELFERDVRNIASYFHRCGVQFDNERWADQVWQRFRFSTL